MPNDCLIVCDQNVGEPVSREIGEVDIRICKIDKRERAERTERHPPGVGRAIKIAAGALFERGEFEPTIRVKVDEL